jgi:hypothetical protein
LRTVAPTPASAKTAGVERVEALLKILAAWNDSFTVRLAGVRAVPEEDDTETATVEETPEGLAVHVSDVVYVEGHLGLVKTKGSLAAEDAVLRGLDALPPYLRTCLDINYLLVISDRDPVRFLLAATGLEALAVGRLGSQPALAGILASGSKPALRSAVDIALEQAGVGDSEKRNRGVERLLGTTLEPVAAHVRQYLDLVALTDASVDDIARWWRVRGEVAHGSGVEIDVSDLNRLMNCFQTALRRDAGIEPIP